MQRHLILFLLLCLHSLARGQSAYEWRYWFDNNHATQVSGQSLGESFTIVTDALGLSEGLHAISIQVADTAGRFSPPFTQLFYHIADRNVTRLNYWFDEDESSHAVALSSNEAIMIDISDLQEGFHIFHSQVPDGTALDIQTSMFIKIPQTEGAGDMACICTIDGKLAGEARMAAPGGVIQWDMDVNAIEAGIHKAMFQVVTPSGAGSTIAERYFVRAMTTEELTGMKCVYTIDNFQTWHEAGTLSDGLFHFDLDVSSIDNGLHRIAYKLISDDGVSTIEQTAFFWKTTLGGDGIMQYNYWVNDCTDQQHTVRLDNGQNPFSLITLLPVEPQPIRTSKFQFAMKDGKPFIYARNDFHIQFFDTNGRLVEAIREYVDEQVSRAVKPVYALLATQTFPKVEEDDIRWYVFDAEEGDTVAFRLSQEASMQVFATNGEEVHKASGAASADWSGTTIKESGKYYVAVHDVTGSQSTMTLDCIMNNDADWADAIKALPADVADDGTPLIYDLSGRRHDEPQEGINIVGKKKVLFRRKKQ